MPTFDIVTIFPAMIEQSLAAGIIGRAVASRLIDVKIRDLRDFTTDRHRVVDDVPYGGGPGMVLKPDPIFRALDAIEAERGRPLAIVLTSPQGRRFTQAEAQRLCELPHLVLLCGRYEGFDDRVRERVTEELSIGDYVLTGGELPALVVSTPSRGWCRASWGMNSRWRTTRSAAGCSTFRSSRGRRRLAIFGCPTCCCRATTPEIRRWRKRAALARTLERRPDLLTGASLDEEEQEILKELRHERD
jgi:tRNA (guanine37-N1)-methyltransferase